MGGHPLHRKGCKTVVRHCEPMKAVTASLRVAGFCLPSVTLIWHCWRKTESWLACNFVVTSDKCSNLGKGSPNIFWVSPLWIFTRSQSWELLLVFLSLMSSFYNTRERRGAMLFQPIQNFYTVRRCGGTPRCHRQRQQRVRSTGPAVHCRCHPICVSG